MQGNIKAFAEKAGRHVMQLLKENMLARVALFAVTCALLFLALTECNGLGHSSQAITAFSEAKQEKNTKAGVQKIEGMEQTQKFQGLHNPFEEEGMIKQPSAKRNGTTAKRDSEAFKAEEKHKNKPSTTKKSLKVRGILQGTAGRAVLVDYDGNQYMLYAGECMDDMTVEAVEEDYAVIASPRGRQVLYPGK